MKKRERRINNSRYILFNQLTMQSLAVASSSCLPWRNWNASKSGWEDRTSWRNFMHQSVITEHISAAVNLAMVMLSETNARKKIGGKRCWQASSTSPSTAQPYSHQLQVLRVFQSQPLPLQCLLFSVFFIIFPPLLIFVYLLPCSLLSFFYLFSSSFIVRCFQNVGSQMLIQLVGLTYS